jgi:hypothetical protein
MEPKMSKPSFYCRGCIFEKIYEDVQVGCQLDLPDKFERQGCKVTIEESAGLASYKIEGRLGCPSFRTPSWPHYGLSNEEIRRKLVEESSMEVDVVILVGDDPQSALDLARDIVGASTDEPYYCRPKQIVFVLDNPIVKASALVNETPEIGTDWRIVNVKFPANEQQALDIGFTGVSAPWVWFVGRKRDIYPDFLTVMNQHKLRDLWAFGYVDVEMGELVLSQLYKNGGCGEPMISEDGEISLMTFKEKVLYMAAAEGHEDLVITDYVKVFS